MIADLVGKVGGYRFFTHNRLAEFSAEQAPGAAADVDKILFLSGTAEHRRGGVVSCDRYHRYAGTAQLLTDFRKKIAVNFSSGNNRRENLGRNPQSPADALVTSHFFSPVRK